MEVEVNQPDVIRSVSKAERFRYVSVNGAQHVTQNTIKPTSGENNGNMLLFTLTPPSPGTIMDTTVLLKMKLTVKASATNTIKLGRLCLESRPLSKMISSVIFNVNGLPLDMQCSSFARVQELLEQNEEMRKRYSSMYPSQINPPGQTYAQMSSIYTPATTDRFSQENSESLSPFASHNIQGNNFSQSRYAFPHLNYHTSVDANHANYITDITEEDSTVANGHSTKFRVYEVCEPLDLYSLLSPDVARGLANVSKLEVKITFESDVHKYIVCNPFAITTGTTATAGGDVNAGVANDQLVLIRGAFENNTVSGYLGCAQRNGAPGTAYSQNDVSITVTRSEEQMLVTYITPSVKIPSQLNLPYAKVTAYKQSGLPMSSGGTQQEINFNAIKMSQIPSMIYVVVRHNQAGKDALGLADPFYAIKSINLQINNQAGILSGASPEQLYLMSVRNGYDGSFRDFSTTNCVLAIRPGTDFRALPGLVSQFSIGGNVKYVNPYPSLNAAYGSTPALELNIFCVDDYMLSITPSMATLLNGVQSSAYTAAEEAEFKRIEEGEDSDNPDETLGSGIYRRPLHSGRGFGRFWKGLKNKVLKPVYNEVVKPILLPAAKTALQTAAAPALGIVKGAVGLAGSGRMLEYGHHGSGTKLYA